MNLVTGATGILGSHVVMELLLNGDEVVAAKQKSSDILQVKKLFSYYIADYAELFDKIKWVELDILDIFSIEEALDNISTVYHCAGFVSFDKKDKKKLTDINEKGTANVVNACLHKKTVALCHVSSIGAINNSDYILPLHEGVFWKTSGKESDYSISKYNGEREVWRGIEEGLNAVIVNPGVILSPGFWKQSSSRMVDACYSGNKFYTAGTTAYIAARDAAKIMTLLMKTKKFGNRYILVENNYSFQHIFNLIHTGLKKPVPTLKISKTVMKIAAFLERITGFFTRNPPRLSTALINSAFNKQTFSNKKIKSTINFRFIPIQEAIEQICRHYLFDKKNKRSSI